ncbi:MAG: hypothetical protein WCO66_01900 [Candidatus Absconditabacteria bacterium]
MVLIYTGYEQIDHSTLTKEPEKKVKSATSAESRLFMQNFFGFN